MAFLNAQLLNNLLQPTPTNALRHKAVAPLQMLFSLACLLEVDFFIFFSVLADKVQALFLPVTTLNFPLQLVIVQLLRILFPVVFSLYFHLVLGSS